MFNWELYRDCFDVLDVATAFRNFYNEKATVWLDYGVSYIENVTKFSKIKSRQVAAVLMVAAKEAADSHVTCIRKGSFLK